MNWKNGSSGSASDADLDIAYAYLMADLSVVQRRLQG